MQTELIWSVLGKRRGSTYTSEYQSYLNELNSLGYTLPDPLIRTAQNQFVKNLKDAGFLARGLRLHIYGFGSLNTGTVNIITPSTFKHIVVGSITFTEGSGVKSGAVISGGYLRTGSLVNESGFQSAFTVAVYVSESSTDIANIMYVYGARGLAASATSGVALRPLSTAAAGVRIGYSSGADSFGSVNHQGLYVLTMTPTDCILWKDGVKDIFVRTPAAPDIADEMLLLSRNTHASGGITSSESYTKNVMMLAEFPDDFSDADELSFRTIWNTFRSSLPALLTWATAAVTWENANVNWGSLYV